jgi:hypothetical protein
MDGRTAHASNHVYIDEDEVRGATSWLTLGLALTLSFALLSALGWKSARLMVYGEETRAKVVNCETGGGHVRGPDLRCTVSVLVPGTRALTTTLFPETAPPAGSTITVWWVKGEIESLSLVRASKMLVWSLFGNLALMLGLAWMLWRSPAHRHRAPLRYSAARTSATGG